MDGVHLEGDESYIGGVLSHGHIADGYWYLCDESPAGSLLTLRVMFDTINPVAITTLYNWHLYNVYVEIVVLFYVPLNIAVYNDCSGRFKA